MNCPNCNEELHINRCLYNVEAYGMPCLVRAPCCGVGLRVRRVISFDIKCEHGHSEDDWGEPIDN